MFISKGSKITDPISGKNVDSGIISFSIGPGGGGTIAYRGGGGIKTEPDGLSNM